MSAIAPQNERIPVYGADTSDYAGDFAEFLSSTDQKLVARLWFEHSFLPEVAGTTCIDFGCGDGEMVPVLQPRFETLVGIDYNADLLARARGRYPNVSFEQWDLRRIPRGAYSGSCGVESHVKYYLDGDRYEVWEALTDSEIACLEKGGKLVNVLQSGSSTYQQMIRELVDEDAAFDLRPWAKEYAGRKGHGIEFHMTEAFVHSMSLEAAVRVGIFMLNLVPKSILKEKRPTRGELAEWIHDRCFDQEEGCWMASCRQDHVVFTVG